MENFNFYSPTFLHLEKTGRTRQALLLSVFEKAKSLSITEEEVL